MKKSVKLFYFSTVLLLLMGCAGNVNEESTSGSSEEGAVSEPEEKDTDETTSTSEGEEADMDKDNEVSSEETVTTDSESTTSNDSKDKDALAEYSSEQIEYARVWLQLGPNQDIDGLYVEHISAGTPLNPDDDTSSTYPEDVIQLAGSRLVDGSVTYSGNGDGTINLYNVPLRWDGEYPAGEEFYTEIIDNTELVAIDVGKDEEVIRLIKLLQEES